MYVYIYTYRKVKLLKNNLSILQLNIKKLPYMMFLGDQLYRIVEHVQKKPRNF